MTMRHVISILMENESGALSRVVGLFSARGYNIESLSVAPTDDESLSRLTLVTRGSEQVVEQILKQLNKLIEVVRVTDLSDFQHQMLPWDASHFFYSRQQSCQCAMDILMR